VEPQRPAADPALHLAAVAADTFVFVLTALIQPASGAGRGHRAVVHCETVVVT